MQLTRRLQLKPAAAAAAAGDVHHNLSVCSFSAEPAFKDGWMDGYEVGCIKSNWLTCASFCHAGL